MKKNFFLLIIVFLFLFFSNTHNVFCNNLLETKESDTSTEYTNNKIAVINIVGNRITSPEIIKSYLGIDTGVQFDSVRINEGKKTLLSTELFSKIDILHIQKSDGVHLYIIIKELFYLYPEGTLYYTFGIYGDTSSLWWKLRAGLAIYNFRGQLETFAIRGVFWEERGIGFSWAKPLIRTPYSIGLSADYNNAPDLGKPRRRSITTARISGIRRINSKIKLFSFLGGSYSRIDTLYNNIKIKSYSELLLGLGIIIDKRNSMFDPKNGFYLLSQAYTNTIYSQYLKFLQIYNDVRLYHNGFFTSDVFACRLHGILRTNDAGPYRNLYMGGEGSVEGYPANYFGRSNIMNNYVVLSLEYRFPMLTSPGFDVWILSYFSDIFKSFYLKIDGALIANAGHIWHDIKSPFANRENGAGAGTGIRIIAPTIRRSGCIDIIWNIPGLTDPYGTKFYPVPSYYLYLDMYF